jgi:hypothetical protein
MNLRNYTSGSPVDRSVSLIEKKLVESGARHISKEYDRGMLVGITFAICDANSKMVPIRLPANIERCEQLFSAEVKRPRKGTKDKIRQQAERTAWKLLADWVDVQCSMIMLQQAEPLEIFLPYLFDGNLGQTFFQALKTGTKFKALPFEE